MFFALLTAIVVAYSVTGLRFAWELLREALGSQQAELDLLWADTVRLWQDLTPDQRSQILRRGGLESSESATTVIVECHNLCQN